MALLLNAGDTVSRSYSYTQPSPLHPSQPQGTGERTGNLFPLDESKLHIGRIENDGTIDYQVGTLTVGTDSVTYEANAAWRGFYTDFIQANENEKLTFSPSISSTIAWSCSCYDENDNFLGKASAQSTASTRIFTLLTGTKKVRMSVTSSSTEYTISQPMLNTGSTALPYEPYGYKLTISSANTTTPVYLGEVETTRKVEKYECTGDENWWFYSDSTGEYGAWQFYVDNVVNGLPFSSALSNVADYGVTAATRSRYPYGVYLVTSGTGIAFQVAGAKDVFPNVAAWKSYLQQQYAAGTPVTVWYVFAEPETAVVNEPLMKIGDYADEVSGISIPTIAGANTLSVGTTVQPSEVSVNYKGWHPITNVHEHNNGAWD